MRLEIPSPSPILRHGRVTWLLCRWTLARRGRGVEGYTIVLPVLSGVGLICWPSSPPHLSSQAQLPFLHDLFMTHTNCTLIFLSLSLSLSLSPAPLHSSTKTATRPAHLSSKGRGLTSDHVILPTRPTAAHSQHLDSIRRNYHV